MAQETITLPRQLVEDMAYCNVCFAEIIKDLTFKYPLLLTVYADKINYIDKTLDRCTDQLKNLKQKP